MKEKVKEKVKGRLVQAAKRMPPSPWQQSASGKEWRGATLRGWPVGLSRKRSPSMAGKAKRRSGVAGMRGLSEQDIDAERL